jgi:hypothetical protein
VFREFQSPCMLKTSCRFTINGINKVTILGRAYG